MSMGKYFSPNVSTAVNKCLREKAYFQSELNWKRVSPSINYNEVQSIGKIFLSLPSPYEVYIFKGKYIFLS